MARLEKADIEEAVRCYLSSKGLQASSDKTAFKWVCVMDGRGYPSFDCIEANVSEWGKAKQ